MLIHDEEVLPHVPSIHLRRSSANSYWQTSARGSALRRKHREAEERSDNDESCSGGIGGLVGAPPIEGTREDIYRWFGLDWPATRKLTLQEGVMLANARLSQLNFIYSPTQIVTPAEGKCLMYALLDQCQYHNRLKQFAKSTKAFRKKTVKFDLICLL